VVLVAKQKLKGMPPGGRFTATSVCLGAEVEMVEVVRDRQVERRQLGVDQEVVVAGIGLVAAGGGHANIGEPEGPAGEARTVLQPHEIDGPASAGRACGPRNRPRGP
jgi:hypothetical protein